MQKKLNSLPVLALVPSAILFAAFLYGGDLASLAGLRSRPSERATPIRGQQIGGRSGIQKAWIRHTGVAAEPEDGGCDVFAGRWVFDDGSRPLYAEEECEFLTQQVTCMANGRPDDGYQKWRWQPQDCDLPRFDPKLLLERLRGKRLMFVGDSLNRNQWESMVCMLQSTVSPGRKSLHKDGSLNVFRIHDYNATVEFYWSPFLVESNSDNPKLHSIIDRIIMPESISKHAVHWEGVDFLIFNTYIWWMNTSRMKVLLRGSFDEGSVEFEEVVRAEAYERVMRTWARWVEETVKPGTSVFFSSVSPLHLRSMDWNNSDGIQCAKETEPIVTTAMPPDVGVNWQMFALALNATRSIRRVPVAFMNITKLSEYRKDAHTSVYTIRQGKLLTPEQKADPETYADCIHWCLPGLPDTWNELLYAKIMQA